MTFPITRNTLEESTIDDWMNEFWAIYKEHDMKRGLIDMWAMASEDASQVGEGVREHDLKKTLNALAHAFCWCASFVARLFNDETIPPTFQFRKNYPEVECFADLIWFKYPAICARCLKAGCICPLLPEAPPKNLQSETMQQARRSGAPPQRVADWESHFSRIYDTAHFIKSIEEIAFHYEEEFGEVFKAIRKLNVPETQLTSDDLRKRQENLLEEIADVVSWTLSLSRKKANDAVDLERYFGTRRDRQYSNRLRFSAVLWDTYKDESESFLACPVCKGRPCKRDCDTSS